MDEKDKKAMKDNPLTVILTIGMIAFIVFLIIGAFLSC